MGVDGVGALFSLLAVGLIAKSNPLKPCGSFRHLEVLRRLRLHTLNELCLGNPNGAHIGNAAYAALAPFIS